MKNKFRLLTLTSVLPALHANAVEVAPGDYEQYPVGATIGAIYYQHSTTNSAYNNGHKVSADFNLNSDVGILRLLHVYALSDTLTIDPQFLLPFGHWWRRLGAGQHAGHRRPDPDRAAQVAAQRSSRHLKHRTLCICAHGHLRQGRCAEHR